MKINEVIHRVSGREVNNPHPKASDPDIGWIYDGMPLTVQATIEDILGTEGVDFIDNAKEGDIVVFHGKGTKSSYFPGDTPQEGGSISVPDLDSKRPSDIAVAAHEAYHALLHRRGKNFENEHLVNKLTINWLKTHLSGIQLHQALDMIQTSRISYKEKKYLSSKQWNNT